MSMIGSQKRAAAYMAKSPLKKTADLVLVAAAALSIQRAALNIKVIDPINDELCNNPVGSIHGKRTG